MGGEGGGLVRVWILKIGAKILQDKITVRFSSSWVVLQWLLHAIQKENHFF